MAVRNLTTNFIKARNNIEENNILEPIPLIDYIVYFDSIDNLFINIENLQKEAESILRKLCFDVFNAEQIEKEYKYKTGELNELIENVRKLFDLKKDIYRKYAKYCKLTNNKKYV